MTSERFKPARTEAHSREAGGARDPGSEARLPDWARSEPPPPLRSPAPLGAAVSVYCEIDGLPASVDIAELSTAGLFVNSVSEATQDAEVEVFLRIDDTTWRAGGHVVQVVTCQRAAEEGRRPGFALLFTHVDEAQRQRLREVLSRLRKQRVASTPPGVGRSAAAASPPSAARDYRPPIATQPAISSGVFSDLPPAGPAGPPTPKSARPLASTSAPPAASSQRPAPNAELAALLHRLRAELRLLEHKPPWGVLGISQGSELQRAKAAFFAASKRYHPHLYSRHGSVEVTKLVTELFIAHKHAYDMMLKAAAAQLPPSAAERGSVPPRATAELPDRAAGASASTRTPSDAPSVARAATADSAAVPASAADARTTSSSSPGKRTRGVELERSMAGALKHIAAGRLSEAQLELERVLELDPQFTSARIWQLVLSARERKANGDPAAAHAQYLEVLTLDGKHHEALAETKKYAKDFRDKQPGLLGKLFGSGNK